MYYLGDIIGVVEAEEGTYLKVLIPQEKILNKLNRYKVGRSVKVEIRVDDGRLISNNQRKKIFATIKDISNFTGNHPEDQRGILLYDYCIQTGEMPFSLSNCTIGQARLFINHIIEFILKHNIPLTDLALNRTEDIDTYLYYCIKYRRCAITGEPGADCHHVTGSRVGMGGDRTSISNRGRELVALSRKWHNRVHQEGEKDIFNLYKIYGITLDDVTLGELRLSSSDIT